jgi:hypothetical protein
MAHFWEDKGLPTKHDNGVKLTDFGTPAASSTQFGIHGGDQHLDVGAVLQIGPDEEVGVRRLNITVQE